VGRAAAAVPGTGPDADGGPAQRRRFAAFLRQHPQLARRGGLASAGAGVALFVAAAVITPLASANTAEPRPTRTTSAPAPVPVDVIPTRPPAVPAVAKVLPREPVHAAAPAPVGHGVISGLAANGIPKVALNAYRVAAARMADAQPGCGIDWALLAGIGREESDHGRFGGAVLHADGVSTPRIIGPALDGVHWDYIAAPANGAALYGDGRFAHALGPMQFIPSTWAIYGTDATGDGRADVFNINDAALGAARYLCAAGGDLRGRAGQERAVLAYNHNDQYLAQVLALAAAYRTGVPITGLPVGITTGPLPKVTDTGYIPPANPGAPTAVDRSAGAKPAGGSKSGAKPTRSATPKPSGSRATAPRPSAGGGSTPGATTSRPPGSSSAAPSTKPTTPASTPTTPASSPTPTPSKSCKPLDIFCHL
jgi:membrane-bound lytic murein transglycosylase B